MTITESEMTINDDTGLDQDTLNDLMQRVETEGVDILGPNGVLTQIVSQVMNRALEAEMTDHLGYDKGDPAGWGSGNPRNGYTPKTVVTEVGEIDISTPRDRKGTFEPVTVPKHARRVDSFNDLVLGLLSRGMTTRDICGQLEDTYGVDISPTQVSAISDGVNPLIEEWRHRPLEAIYPILYLDAISVKVRTDGKVTNRPCYIALGINLAGEKHVLGMWLGDGGESAKYWLGVCSELANRGVKDVLIACTDGLTGFAEAIEVTWPLATVQTCVVHLIRNSMRYVAYQDRKAVARALKPIYTAANADEALERLSDFDAEWGAKYPAVADTWTRAWERFVPFLDFKPEIRKVIYTTNAIESLNYQLRKVTKTRGSFPTDQACLKLLFLAISNIGNDRGGQLGTHTQGWKRALNAFTISFPGRVEAHIDSI